jgi:hypothetical protein
MKSKAFLIVAIGYTFLSTLMNISVQKSTQAQDNTCYNQGVYEPASSTLRTITLPDFGITVDIPSNYRAMKREDGSVIILHSRDFELLQCIRREGQRGPGGSYFQQIQLVEPKNSMSLQQQAEELIGERIDRQGNRVPSGEMIEYKQGDLSGYIITYEPYSYSVVFMGMIPNTEKILRIAVQCDCRVKLEDLMKLLSGVKLL